MDRGAGETPREGGTLRIPIAHDPGSLNPLSARGRGAADFSRLFYPSLLNLRPQGAAPPAIQGDLARSWRWDPEKRLLVCALRRDRLWEDTTRVTPGDVLRTYAAYRAAGWMERRAPGDSLPDAGLVSVTAGGDSTVELSFAPGFSFWRALAAATWPILPSRRLTDLAPAMLQASPLAREPLSAGPFRLTDWRPGQGLWCDPNPLIGASRRPHVDRITFDICPGIDARVLRLAYGKADLVLDAPVFRLDELLEPGADLILFQGDVASVELVLWSQRGLPAAPEIREAVSLATNRPRLVDELLTWRGEVCGGPAGGLLEPSGPPADSVEAVAPVETSPVAAGRDPAEGGLLKDDPLDHDSSEHVSLEHGSREHESLGVRSHEFDSTGAGPAGLRGADPLVPLPVPLAGFDSVSADSHVIGHDATARDSIAPSSIASDTMALASPLPDALPVRAPRYVPMPVYDRTAANRVLDAAGWIERDEEGYRTRGGLRLRLELLYDRGNLFRERVATRLEEDLAAVGIELVPVPLDGSSLWARFQSGLFEGVLLGFRPPIAPDLAPLWSSRGAYNRTGFASPRVDSLCAALAREENPATVTRLARQVESILRRSGPATFLVWRAWTALGSPHIRGYEGTAEDPLLYLERVWLADTTGAAGR